MRPWESSRDEVNVTIRGSNFGWPIVSYGCPYGSRPCDPIGGGIHAPRFVEPVASWGIPSIVPSGMTFFRGEQIPEWQGRILVGALAGTNLWVIDPVPDETRICLPAASRRHCADVPIVSTLAERIRDLREAPDGWVYLLTDSAQGRLILIERQSAERVERRCETRRGHDSDVHTATRRPYQLPYFNASASLWPCKSKEKDGASASLTSWRAVRSNASSSH